jgi:hypothetical protein
MQQIVLFTGRVCMPLTHFLRLTHGGPFSRFAKGYTGHSFNDFNHVDLTTMLDRASDNENDGEVCLLYMLIRISS